MTWNRTAQKLFKQAPRDPTENTVAQVGWASQHVGKIPMDESVLGVPRLLGRKRGVPFGPESG